MTGSWLIWMWRYHSLDLSTCETREEAMSLADSIQDYGDGSLHAVEGPSGVVTAEEWDQWESEKRDRIKAERAANPLPKNTHKVEALAPGDRNDWAFLDSYPSEDAAKKAATPLRELLGDKRVKVTRQR